MAVRGRGNLQDLGQCPIAKSDQGTVYEKSTHWSSDKRGNPRRVREFDYGANERRDQLVLSAPESGIAALVSSLGRSDLAFQGSYQGSPKGRPSLCGRNPPHFPEGLEQDSGVTAVQIRRHCGLGPDEVFAQPLGRRLRVREGAQYDCQCEARDVRISCRHHLLPLPLPSVGISAKSNEACRW